MLRYLYALEGASEKNMERINDIKQDMQRLSDPRITNRNEAERLIEELPAITWLLYSVHGTEISSLDAALLTAYHLVPLRWSGFPPGRPAGQANTISI